MKTIVKQNIAQRSADGRVYPAFLLSDDTYREAPRGYVTLEEAHAFADGVRAGMEWAAAPRSAKATADQAILLLETMFSKAKTDARHTLGAIGSRLADVGQPQWHTLRFSDEQRGVFLHVMREVLEGRMEVDLTTGLPACAAQPVP
jgi:hypothetical protein